MSAHSLEVLGDDDRNHLERATAMGRVLCTYDADFLRLASEGVEHAGIIFARQQKASIGRWVCEIRSLHARLHAEDVVGQVVFLSVHSRMMALSSTRRQRSIPSEVDS